MATGPHAALGRCPVCNVNNICIIPSSGLLRRHGFGFGPGGRAACSGSYGVPSTHSMHSSMATPPTPATTASDSSLQPLPPTHVAPLGYAPRPTGPESRRGTIARPSVTLLLRGAGELDCLGGEGQQRQHSAPFTPVNRPTKVLKWIPKGARGAAASLLQTLLTSVTNDPSNTTAWSRLVGYASACFGRPDRGGRSSNLTKAVLRAIDEYGRGTVQQSGAQHGEVGVNLGGRATRRFPTVASDERRAARASEKMCEGDVKGAIRLLCSQESFLPSDASITAKLRSLHPPAPPDRRLPPVSAVAPLFVSPSAVLGAVMSFNGGSSSGPDGLRPQHLKDLLMSVGEGRLWRGGGENTDAPSFTEQPISPSPLLMAVTAFVNVLLGGTPLPPFVRRYIFGASLTALSKPGGGVRPIAVGLVWRRLTAKVAVRSVSLRAAAMLAPRQLGFGVGGGAEAIAHAGRQFISMMGEGDVLVKLDFKNAFNCLRRDSILTSTEKYFPELLPFVTSSYGNCSDLFYGPNVILSDEGVQQGDPLGPLLFCLTINDALKGLHSTFVAGYLDDITLGGDIESVLRDVANLQSDAIDIGMSLNPLKSEIFSASHSTAATFASHHPGFKPIDNSTINLLGSPLHILGQEVVLKEKCQDLARVVTRLKFLPFHDSLFLLKNIFSIPKLLYILRSSPAFLSPSLLLYDNLLTSSISSLFNVSLSGDASIQASLPVRLGGLGIRSSSVLAPSAFIASCHGTAALASQLLPPGVCHFTSALLASAVQCWESCAPTGYPATQPTVESHASQRAWDGPVCTAIADSLLASSPAPPDRARLVAVRSPWAGDWLQAIPVASLGLHLDDSAISISLGLRLGATTVHEHFCVCGAPVGRDGHHGLACTMSAGRHYRHSSVNNILHLALQSCGIPSQLEPTGLIPSSNLRPDGVTLLPWRRGVPMIWDFTCPDSLAPSHLSITSATAGAAAEAAEGAKAHKYSSFSPSYKIIPIAVETLGAYGTSARSLVGDLGARITRSTGEHRSTLFLRQRISIAVQRGNALSVLGTQRHMPPHDRLA